MRFFDFRLEDMRKRKGRKWNTYGSDVIPLWIADADFPVIPEIKAAIIKALIEEDFYYSYSTDLQEVMAEKVSRVNRIDASPDDVYVTQGVLPALWLACKYTCEPGDEVLVTDPMYYPFYRAVSAVGAKPIYWGLDEGDGYRFDVDLAQELVTKRTRLIFVCNPHNPTGRVMTKEELEGIADLAVDNGLTVLVDELWEDVIYDGRKNVSLASLKPDISERTITTYGFSKTYGVAGLQIGYLVATNKDMLTQIKKIGAEVLRGTSNLSKAAARVMLSEEVSYYKDALMEHLHEMRDLSMKRLGELEAVECKKLEGTFLLFPRISSYGLSSKEMTAYLLEKARVAVSDGSLFGPRGEGHIRINIGTSRRILTEAFDRIQGSLSPLMQ